MIDRIQARRDALADQLASATLQYNELESTLKRLDRQICAMHGGLQELDALLADEPAALRDDRDLLMSRLGEAHQALQVTEESHA